MKRTAMLFLIFIAAALLLTFLTLPAQAHNSIPDASIRVLTPHTEELPALGGDGFFSGADMLLLKAYLLQTQAPTENHSAAGISMTDFLLTKQQLLKLSQLSLQQIAGIQPCSTQILTPSQTLNWDTGTQEAVQVLGSAVSWENGTIAAREPGNSVVRCGSELLAVAVCSEPLTVSLPEQELLLDPGASARLNVQLNHPVTRPVTYTVSDSTVAKVNENGLVTALKEGTATVTAALPDGQQASQSIRVVHTAKSITLSHTSVKVKNDGSPETITATVSPENMSEPLVWTSSDPAIGTVDENGVVTGMADGYVTITCTAKYSGVSASCQVKVCNLIQVALTFDDGPSAEYTMKLLDALEQYDVRATFFFVGNRIYTAKDAVQRMVEQGHELGYHTWAHEFFYNMDESQIKSDFRKFQSVLKSACGQGATVYRAPGGSITGPALRNIPLPHIYWSVDTLDWKTRSTEKVKNAILDGLEDGAIILLHDIHGTTYTGTVAALEEIFAQDMDVEFLTVTQLLSRDGTPPNAGTTYYEG